MSDSGLVRDTEGRTSKLLSLKLDSPAILEGDSHVVRLSLKAVGQVCVERKALNRVVALCRVNSVIAALLLRRAHLDGFTHS